MTRLLRRRQHRGQQFGRVSDSAAVSGNRTARRSRLRNRMKDQAEEDRWIMRAPRTPSTCARESKGRCNRVPLTKGPGHSGECEKPVCPRLGGSHFWTFQPAVVSPGESRNLGVLANSTRMRKKQPVNQRRAEFDQKLGTANGIRTTVVAVNPA